MYSVGVELTGNDSSFTAAANRAVGSLNRIGQAAAKAAAGAGKRFTESIGHAFSGTAAQFVSAEFFLSKAEQTLEWADAMQRLSETFQISTHDLQVLEQVSRTENVSIQTLASSIRRLTVAQVEARSGKGSAFEAFGRLGVDLTSLQSKSALQLWSQIGKAIGEGGDQAQNMADAVTLLGRNADQVLPALKSDLKEISDSIGANFVSRENIDQLAAAQKQLDRSGKFATILASPVLSGLIRGIDMAVHSGIRGREDDGFIDREVERIGSNLTEAEQDAARQIATRLDASRRAKRMAAENADFPSVLGSYFSELAATEEWAAGGIPRNFKPSALSSTISADSLARIGGRIGGYDPTHRVLGDMLMEAKRQTKALQQLDHDLTSED